MGCGSSSVEGRAVAPAMHAHSPMSTILLPTNPSISLQQYGTPLCVLVSDMSGFTKETRQYGIIHFGSKIVRMRQIMYPILRKYQPLVIETEADNFLVLFASIQQGLLCAVDMMACLEVYNKLVPPHMKLVLGGIGIDWGEVTLETPAGHLFGVASDGAFQLGEDISDGDILCSKRVHALLHTVEYADLLTQLELTYSDENKDELIECLQGGYYIVKRREAEDGLTHTTPDSIKQSQAYHTFSSYFLHTDDPSYIGEDCLLLAKRHDHSLTSEQLQQLDGEIEKKYMTRKEVTVCMFGLHMERVTLAQSIPAAFRLKHRILDMLMPIIRRYGGRCVEDTFIVWEQHESDDEQGGSEWRAVATCMEFQAAMKHYNENVPPNQQVAPKGFGVHSGRMLIVPGTNVHWSDCVSTASKLGEDLAEENEVLISDLIYTRIKAHPLFAHLHVEEKHLSTSGVNFVAYSLSGTLNYAALPHTFLAPAISPTSSPLSINPLHITSTPNHHTTTSTQLTAQPTHSSLADHDTCAGQDDAPPSPTHGTTSHGAALPPTYRHSSLPPHYASLPVWSGDQSVPTIALNLALDRRSSVLAKSDIHVSCDGGPVQITSGVVSPLFAVRLGALEHTHHT